ncbi:hypothetical protein Q9R46_26955 [Paenibacillus sp. RRE4]|uniref:hypothetical protein n=1 Tax=Paenibacillus TaxID=44249 RepID=UPI0011A24466|nr:MULTISPECIES: hypothetical protein [Paenibacillus]MDT0126313.1 hypothetical protein [Paenibacillus sp. RRE4]
MLRIASKPFKASKVAILSVVLFSSVAGSAFAALNTSPDLTIFPYSGTTNTYVEGGVYASTRDKNVSKIRAYYELYRDGAYLGSGFDEQNGNVFNQGGLSSAAANISSKTHYLPGTYKMNWSSRIVYYFGSDADDAGAVNLYKSSSSSR